MILYFLLFQNNPMHATFTATAYVLLYGPVQMPLDAGNAAQA
jgi:hypothetical protein